MWQKYSGNERRTQLYSFVPVITAGSTASSAGGDTGSLSGIYQAVFSGKGCSGPADLSRWGI